MTEQHDAPELVFSHYEDDQPVFMPRPATIAPPAPSGFVDAAQALIATIRNAPTTQHGNSTSRIVGCFTWLDLVNAADALDATLSGQQGGAVPAGAYALGELLAIAETQKSYWMKRQRAEKSFEDGFDEDGNYTPVGEDAISRHSYCNGRYSEADWWLHALRTRLAEQPKAPAGDLRPGLGEAIEIVKGAHHTTESPDEAGIRIQIVNDLDARLAEQPAPAGMGDANRVEGLRVKPLDWKETFTDRGDGTHEVTGWEAATGFSEWYSVESYMSSDSYGYQALLGYEVIKSTDDPEAAKEHAQADYERRIRAALDGASGQGEG